MGKEHVMWVIVFVVAYFVGAKFPMLAHKTGLV